MKKGIVFDVQYNCIYDGPGIRTCVFLKGCPLRCDWCHNPESQSLRPQIGYTAERCTGCGACAEACPNGALTVKKGVLKRDSDLCKICGACAAACPNRATELIGYEAGADELAEKVARDKPFYETSGGGATISGGEPTLQYEFLLELLAAIRAREVHTAIETCGHFDPAHIGRLAELVDLFLFDIKHLDPAPHERRTGVSNEKILSNFRELLELVGAERVTPRVPVIPGFNAGAEFAARLASFLKEAGRPGPVHLMPYNPLAGGKWEKIGKQSPYARIGALADDDLKAMIDTLAAASFEVVCNK